MFCTDVNEEDIKNKVEDARILSKLDPKEAQKFEQYKKLMLDQYGNLDPAKMLEYLNSKKPVEGETKVSLAEFNKGKKVGSRYTEANIAKSKAINPDIRAALAGEGNPSINSKELANILKNPDTLDILALSPLGKLMDPKAKEALDKYINTEAANKVGVAFGGNENYPGMSKVKDWTEAIDKFKLGTSTFPMSRSRYDEMSAAVGSLKGSLNKPMPESVRTKLKSKYDRMLTLLKKTDKIIKKVQNFDIAKAEQELRDAEAAYNTALYDGTLKIEDEQKAAQKLADKRKLIKGIKNNYPDWLDIKGI
jgi:hypothetical protein